MPRKKQVKRVSDISDTLQENNAAIIPQRSSTRTKKQTREYTDWLSDITDDKTVQTKVKVEPSEEDYKAVSESEESTDELSSVSDQSEPEVTRLTLTKASAELHESRPGFSVKYSTSSVCASSNSFDTFKESMGWTFERTRLLEKENGVSLPLFLPKLKRWTKNLDCFELLQSPVFNLKTEKRQFTAENCKLDPFSALPVSKSEDELVFCAGGPVSALSWCPQSISRMGSTQYLAVSVNTKLHVPGQIYKEKVFIQIWNCGNLYLTKHSATAPRIVNKICVNDGPVWDLTWCQLGGYIPKSDDGNSRLGILAAACASGSVLVMSIPDPELHVEYSKGDTYNVAPDFTLVPHTGAKEDFENIFGQCLCVDWRICGTGKWLAGGYSKGIACLWEISNPSSLLQTVNSEGNIEIVACRTFTAHTQPIRGIRWCPSQEDIFATASSDGSIKLWNKRYVHTPCMQTASRPKLGALTGITWPLLWCGLFASTDEVFARFNQCGLMYCDIFTQLSSPYSVVPFRSCCQAVSFSDWMNAGVSVDSVGVTVIYLAHNMNSGARTYNKIRPRLISSYITVEWSDNIEAHELNEGFKVQFHDSNLKNLQNLKRRPCCTRARLLDSFTSSVNDKPYVQSVNRVAWNPNFGSHTWYATGWHCGLVRVQNVGALHNSLNTIYKKLCQQV